MNKHTQTLIVGCALSLTLLCTSSPVTAADADSGVTFGPYVQRLKKTAVSILLHTDLPQVVRLKYRKVGATNWKKTHDVAANQHSIRLTDLEEGTSYEYYFQNSDNHRITQTYTFTTKRKVNDDNPLRIAVFGDSGRFTTDQFRVATQIQWWKPDLLLHTGDIAYDSGTSDELVTRFFKVYQPIIAEVPFYGTLGNHDEVTDSAAAYKEFFECPTKYNDTEEYYAFDYGPVHFVSLNGNSDYTEGSAMYDWLVNDLRSSSKKWKIVFFHQPVYSSGLHGSTSGMAEVLGPVFENEGVNLVLNGHDHDYERNEVVNGVLYIVTGGGGHSLYDRVSDNPKSEVFVSEYHFVGLSITKESITGKAVDKRGYTFDDFSLTQ